MDTLKGHKKKVLYLIYTPILFTFRRFLSRFSARNLILLCLSQITSVVMSGTSPLVLFFFFFLSLDHSLFLSSWLHTKIFLSCLFNHVSLFYILFYFIYLFICTLFKSLFRYFLPLLILLHVFGKPAMMVILISLMSHYHSLFIYLFIYLCNIYFFSLLSFLLFFFFVHNNQFNISGKYKSVATLQGHSGPVVIDSISWYLETVRIIS